MFQGDSDVISFHIYASWFSPPYRVLHGNAPRYLGPLTARRAIRGLVALTALGMNWTEDDTVKTTMNGISNITFIKRRQTRVSN